MLKAFAGSDGVYLHLFSIGCEDITFKYASQYSNIIIHKQVPNNLIGQVYGQADILVGQGNATADFLPSKTYEYIVTGKPIIYFNHGRTDNKALENYPLKLQISDSDDITMSAGKLHDFCKSSVGKKISVSEIDYLYAENSKQTIKTILSLATHN